MLPGQVFFLLATLQRSAGDPAPSVTAPLSKWINSPPLTIEKLKGKVVIVEFWTFGCINCKHNLPIYSRWYHQFPKEKFAIVGIHTPETSSERVDANVAAAVKRNKIEYPVVIDSNSEIWNKWKVTAWPTVFLVDRNGRIIDKAEGELNWQGADGEGLFARTIEKLLKDVK